MGPTKTLLFLIWLCLFTSPGCGKQKPSTTQDLHVENGELSQESSPSQRNRTPKSQSLSPPALLPAKEAQGNEVIKDEILPTSSSALLSQLRLKTYSGAIPAAASVGQVRVNGVSLGTCFLTPTTHPKLKGYSVFATAAHVLENVTSYQSSQIQIVMPDGRQLSVIRHAVAKHFDVAALIVRDMGTGLHPDTGLSIGSACVSINYSGFNQIPDNTAIISTGHIIASSGDDIWAFLMPFAKGGSGAPLLVANKTIGLINARILDDNKNPTGIVHAIKIQSILNFIDNLQ